MGDPAYWLLLVNCGLHAGDELNVYGVTIRGLELGCIVLMHVRGNRISGGSASYSRLLDRNGCVVGVVAGFFWMR